MSRLRRRPLRVQKKNRNSFIAPQLIEHLEKRQLLVGNVQAVVSGNNLILNGENSANQVQIVVLNGDVVVQPLQGTRINGRGTDFVAFQNTDTVPGSIYAKMRQGDDTVILARGLKVQKDIYVEGHQGDDTLALDNVIIRDDVVFVGGTGNDNLSIDDTRVVDKTVARLSLGDDLVRVVGADMRDDLRVHGHNGDDSVVLDDARIVGTTHLKLHSGQDAVSVVDSFMLGRVRINTRQGDDAVQIDDSVFDRTVRLRMSSGSDELALGEGDGDGDNTPDRGNVFRKGFVATGGSGVDTSEVDVDNEFRSVRNIASFEGDGFNTGIVDDAVTASDDLETAILDFIDVNLTADITTDGTSTIQFGSGDESVFTTDQGTVTITGVTDANGTVEVDNNEDGTFDLTATADGTGSYSIDVPLVQDSVHTIDIRNADQTNESFQFTVQNVTGRIARMQTSLGDIDIELLDNEVGNTVDNFVGYFDRYGDNLIVHRSPGDFVIQAGGFTVTDETVDSIVTDPNIPGEFDPERSNVPGTLSMALSSGADTGNSQWFINVTDNANLDDNFHTVFGFLLGVDQGPSFDVAQEIDQLEDFNIADVANQGALTQTPLRNFDDTPVSLSGTVSVSNLSSDVTGVGTAFQTELSVGDSIILDGESFVVSDITSNTELELSRPVTQDITNSPFTTPAVPDETNYVIFSDISLIDSLSDL